MMTPKEKAKELLDKYRTHIRIADACSCLNSIDEIDIAKKCALIVVDEVLKSVLSGYDYDQDSEEPFWQEVKTEINNL